jgi:uncharacterized protein
MGLRPVARHRLQRYWRTHRVVALLFVLLLGWTHRAFADVAVPPAPPASARVVDLTNTLSGDDIAAQARRLIDFQRRKGSQIAVLIVPTTQPETIEQYSIRVAEAWKIGRKKIDDGALLVVAKSDRKLRIEVGYGLEGALTDVTARRIIDETIAPRFKTGDFSGGIAAGITRMIGVIDGEPLPVPRPEASHESDAWWLIFLNPLNPFTLIAIYGTSVASRRMLGRLGGSLAAGGIFGAAVWYLLGSLAVGGLVGGIISALTFFADNLSPSNWTPIPSSPYRGRRHSDSGWSSGWSGGGGGGGSSWGSSDSGSSSSSSDSDTGGSFGGGGASGSW